MMIKKKGKVYPSPTSASAPKDNSDVLSVLNLLPATILTLTSLLSLDDRQVLAYMITRSLQTPTTTTFNNHNSTPLKPIKKKSNTNNNNNSHQVPKFECDCFECYTSYWYKWDSSSNRELIHQVIEAFEDHLYTTESSTKNTPRGTRRRSRRPQPQPQQAPSSPPAEEEPQPPVVDGVVDDAHDDVVEEGEAAETAVVAVAASSTVEGRKGLARKVLPDVLGLLNSRLWGLWNPNV